MNRKTILFLIIGLLALGVIFALIYKPSSTPEGNGKYDNFAQCLKNKGTLFYGAFWCPHCLAQKKLFGSSEKYLPYVECSTPDGSSETQFCIDKKIETYPTWVFPDGTRLSGEIPLEQLAQKTSCQLP